MTPGRADPQVVRRHLAALRAALANLRPHVGASAQTLRVNSDLRWTVERGLQICAQNALDVSTHLASAAGLDTPDYASAVDRLVEADVLPEEFGSRFREVAGFRNVLVHAYLDVDLDVVVRVLSERLEDFDAFARYVERYLTR